MLSVDVNHCKPRPWHSCVSGTAVKGRAMYTSGQTIRRPGGARLRSSHGAQVEDPPVVLADPWNEEGREPSIFL